MHERAPRPSRLVQSMARWAVTLGAAGTIVGATAMYGVLLRNEPVTNQYNLLVLAALLLAMAFVLAPIVRRTFGSSLGTRKSKSPARRTLLDEMRETPQLEGDIGGDSGGDLVGEAAPAAPALDEPAAAPSLAARLIAVAYGIFGAMLLMILWALQTK